MGFFGNLLGEASERDLFRKSAKIVKHAQKANEYLTDVVHGKNDLVKKIRYLKGESGSEVFSLSNSITGGAIAPNLIDDFMRFVDREDHIVDNIFKLARAIARYRIKNGRAAEETRRSLLKALRLVDNTLNALLKMHNAETVEEMKKLRTEIERFEHEDDEIKESLLDFAYNKRMGHKDFYQMMNVAYLSDDIVDSCEDASDMLLSIMLSILT